MSEDQQSTRLERFFAPRLRVLGWITGPIWLGAYWLAMRFWLADLFCNFLVQIVLLILFVTAGLLFVKSYRVAIFSLAMLALCSWPLVRYSVPTQSSRADQQGTNLTILVQNVLTTNQQYERLSKVIGTIQPDILILLEPNNSWFENLEPILKTFSFREEVPNGGNFGIAVYSKFPSLKTKVRLHGDFQIPSIIADLEVRGQVIQVAAVHPFPPTSFVGMKERDQLCREIVGAMDLTKPRIVAGDFNMIPWTPKFHRLLDDGQLTDASLGYGFGSTWFPLTMKLSALGLKIDHVLTSENMYVENFRLADEIGSDHRGIIVQLVLPD